MSGMEPLALEPGAAGIAIEEAPDQSISEPPAPDALTPAVSPFPPEPAQNVRERFQTYESQWRYLGDRLAADTAYCLRFGVAYAPEPFSLPGSVWAYAIPGGQSSR